jgi:hypothetical protein
LQKYWPEHFKPIYFITNEKSPPYGEAIKINPDRGWADNLRLALESIPQEYILYAQEDYWLDKHVETEMISDYVNRLRSSEVDYIRLYPAPPPDKRFLFDERLGVIDTDAEYRTSLQMALWRKSTLLALLKSGETPWDFEIHGSQRSRVYANRFLCVQKRRFGISYLFTAIVDCEWSPMAFEYARNEGIQIQFDSLPRKSLVKSVMSRMRKQMYRFSRQIGRPLSRK